jgi:hypothetical protein
MLPGGPVRQPYSYSVSSPHRLFKNSSTAVLEKASTAFEGFPFDVSIGFLNKILPVQQDSMSTKFQTNKKSFHLKARRENII